MYRIYHALRKAALVFGAVVILAACHSIFDNGLYIGPATITPVHGGQVVGHVGIRVVNQPRALEGYIFLQYKVRGNWTTQEEVIYRLADLPRSVIMQAPCRKGLWRIYAHVIGITGDGYPQDVTAIWPSPGGQRIRKCD